MCSVQDAQWHRMLALWEILFAGLWAQQVVISLWMVPAKQAHALQGGEEVVIAQAAASCINCAKMLAAAKQHMKSSLAVAPHVQSACTAHYTGICRSSVYMAQGKFVTPG